VFNEEQMGGLLALEKCELMINMGHVISDHAFNATICRIHSRFKCVYIQHMMNFKKIQSSNE
jgi:hypothetical protein